MTQQSLFPNEQEQIDDLARKLAYAWLSAVPNSLDAETFPFRFSDKRVMVQVVRCDENGVPVTEWVTE